MESSDRTLHHGTVPKRIDLIKLEAYHVLSALKDNFRNHVPTTSLVPVLGADNPSGRALQEASITKLFKMLIMKGVSSENIFVDIGNLRPFLDVMKLSDSKQTKLIILCAEALSKFVQCEAVKFIHKNSATVINTVFEEILGLFSANVEPKEDLLTLKILKTLGDILHSKGGNLITNGNICIMFKVIVTLLTVRHRNVAIRKLMHDEIIRLLQYSLGQYSRTTTKTAKSKPLARRVSTTFIFISLLLSQKTNAYPFNFHVEDSFLSPEDKEILARFRSDISILSQNIIPFPSLWNDFCSEVHLVGLETLNQIMEHVSLAESQFAIALPIVQVFVTSSIYRMCFTESLSLYCMVLRAVKNTLSCFRMQMKSQMEVLLSHIISSVTNHLHGKKVSAIRQDIIEMNLEFLVDICNDTQLLMEIYANYDCHVRCTNLADMLIKGIIACLGSSLELNNKGESDEQAKSKAASKSPTKRRPVVNATKSPGDGSPNTHFEYMALKAIQGILNALAADVGDRRHGTIDDIESDYAKGKQWKETLRKAADIFNTTKLGDGWIPLIKELGLLPEDHTSQDVSIFLKYLPGLDLKKVGEYLGTHKNPEFMTQVRSQFAKLYNFRGLPIVMAIRLFLSSFRLPGESQMIERIIEIFAHTYFESQPLVEDDQEEESDDKTDKKKVDDNTPENKKPRWVVQENVFWQLNLTSLGNPSLGTLIGHISDEKVDLYQRFKKQFMENEMECILTNERINSINEAIKDESLLAGIKLAHVKASNSVEDDPKMMKLKDPKEVQGRIKPGFAYVANADVIFVLSYSIIMLNTDQHNSQIKKKMKLEDFVRNNSGINNGKNLPYEFLEDIYTTIKHHEIKLHNGDRAETVQYDDFFWVDHVLQRQATIGAFNTDLLRDSYYIKTGILGLLYQNSFEKTLNYTYHNAQSVPSLKRCARIIWLMMRVGILLNQEELINRVFQMSGISVSDSIGYRCQLSLAFILNAVAVASDLFDRQSWEKVMDTIIKLYCLNLLPLSFASLDIDHSIYGNCSAITDILIPPTIRFKRNSELRRAGSWLGGWTNFISFGKPVYSSSIEQGDGTDFDVDDLGTVTFEKQDKSQSHQFLFLYDVQSGCDNVMGNQYFNVELIRRGVSPIATKEDADAINEVTEAFGNEVDREELLPQVLAYMNLRLAFLNIYNINRLFMGSTTNISSGSYIRFIQVVFKRIIDSATKEKETTDGLKPMGGGAAQQVQGSLALVRVETSYSHAGALLEPSQKELKSFRSTAEPVFALGLFNKSCISVLERTKYALNENDATLEEDLDAKFRATLISVIMCFHALGNTLVLPQALPYIPSIDEVLRTLGIQSNEDQIYKRVCEGGSMSLSEESQKKLSESINEDSVLSSYICIMMLKLVIWLTDNSCTYGSVPLRSQRSEIDMESRPESFSNSPMAMTPTPDEDGTKWAEICVTLSAWLLHFLTNFHNGVFYNYIESLMKVLSKIASNRDIPANAYFTKVVLAATQRISNNKLPFFLKQTPSFAKQKKQAVVMNIIGSVLQPLMRNRNYRAVLRSHDVMQYLLQALLSMALFNNEKNRQEGWNHGRLAIQVLMEVQSLGRDSLSHEALWLYAVHALTIICSMGPKSLYLESMKALTKLLLKETAPKGRCKKITQVIRIFDYILAPSLTSKLNYPLQYSSVLLPFGLLKAKSKETKTPVWTIGGPFSSPTSDESDQPIWMQHVIQEYMESYKNSDIEDLNTRKAEISSLTCQYMLANLSTLNSMELELADEELVKDAASNLECLLYSSDQAACSEACVKRFITVTNYILNVIILSNGDDYNDVSGDTYVESLKNFVLVLLTSPELKNASKSCLEHFTNDAELKECLTVVHDCVDMSKASPGEYVLSSLLAHLFSTSELLKELFLDVLKVVFFTPYHEEDEEDEKEEQADEEEKGTNKQS